MERRCLLIEDHPLFVEAMQIVLGRAFPDLQIEHALSFGDALAAIRTGPLPQIVILDLRLPDTLGLQGLIELRRLWPRMPVLINSGYTDRSLVLSAIICGAAGYIPKTADRTAVISTIDKVLACGFAMPDACRPHCSSERLTHQQVCVLHMMCQGLGNKQIGKRLAVYETTVKAHVSEILRKLGVTSRTQAVLKVMKVCAEDEQRCWNAVAGGQVTPGLSDSRKRYPVPS